MITGQNQADVIFAVLLEKCMCLSISLLSLSSDKISRSGLCLPAQQSIFIATFAYQDISLKQDVVFPNRECDFFIHLYLTNFEVFFLEHFCLIVRPMFYHCCFESKQVQIRVLLW